MVIRVCQRTTKEFFLDNISISEKQLVLLFQQSCSQRLLFMNCKIPEINLKYRIKGSLQLHAIHFLYCNMWEEIDNWSSRTIPNILKFLFEPPLFPCLKEICVDDYDSLQYAYQYKSTHSLDNVEFIDCDGAMKQYNKQNQPEA
ncbi:unnamed protein product [Moneuplotes crassus]|uniref:Uncharacterized protein n=1 Tax=Euplotes crassus TaxID=5936 RepID=A0AAD1XLT7_EUPCR|nr:unnamed protein product [Moneuplotes crassus]